MKEQKEEIKELIIARLMSMPENHKVSIGSSGEFDKYDLIEHVKKEDKIGEKIIEIQLHFLKRLKEGLFINE